MSYVPVGGTDETIAFYEKMCEMEKGGHVGSGTTWYCDMAAHLKKMRGVTNPPPPPEPPPFVAIKTPPAEVAAGSEYQQWFMDQAAKQARRQQMFKYGVLAVLGYAAYTTFVKR